MSGSEDMTVRYDNSSTPMISLVSASNPDGCLPRVTSGLRSGPARHPRGGLVRGEGNPHGAAVVLGGRRGGGVARRLIVVHEGLGGGGLSG